MVFNSLQDRFYHQKPPQRVRAAGKQMQVLCLGLSRSGTDSLRTALKKLGYDQVYHGFSIIESQRTDTVFWTPLIERKLRQGGDPLIDVDFDQCLGNCEAVTDNPANLFGEELIDYYPKAKVILNRRKDFNAWYASYRKLCQDSFSWTMWFLGIFDRRLYWLWRMYYPGLSGYFNWDLEQNGKAIAKAHYVNLEDKLQESEREYIYWTVEDGWEPLCKFLSKPVPDEPFPHTNRGTGANNVQDNIAVAVQDLVKNSVRNISIFMVFVSIAVSYFRYELLWLLLFIYKIAGRSRVKEEVLPDMSDSMFKN